MFGSVVIEVGLGLVIVFLLFSLILTSLQEGIEAIFKGRAKFLQSAIGELLDTDPETRADHVKAFYNHPLIFPLFSGDYKPAPTVGPTNLPSYVSSSSFAKAVEDLARSGKLNSAQVTSVMTLANEWSGGDLGSVQKSLETWFDGAMERLSGRYKRNTNGWLFGIALLAAAAGNVNAIHIADSLASSQKLRADVAAFATELGKAGTLPDNAENEIRNEISAAGLPIGWQSAPTSCNPLDIKTCGKSTIVMFAGWTITALAGMLGAPFWFDMLQKLVRLRTALKPRDGAAAPQATQSSAPGQANDSGQKRTPEDVETPPEWKAGFVNAEEIRL